MKSQIILAEVNLTNSETRSEIADAVVKKDVLY